MEPITAEYMARLVNFYSEHDKPDWKYAPKANDMRNLQVKGSAKIFNLLCKHNIALLADEVGMGKTIQALAVCAALWNQKPNARILVIAPREVVALNWLNEYKNFIRNHYRHGDEVVKTASGNKPVKQAYFCSNLFDLANGVRQDWPNLFVAKTTSFSTLMAGDLAQKRLKALGIKEVGGISKENKGSSERVARLIKNCIVEASDKKKPYFDLVIIDEAHYFRNSNSDSLRQQTARILFSDSNSSNNHKLAKHVLLLTATPNHSSSGDIANILSLFGNKIADNQLKNKLDNLLQTYCVRRLRKLGTPEDAKIKYNYREETESESDFAKDPLSEMFFGLYQHELVKRMRSSDGHSKNGTGINQMMKYLEGVEFIPSNRPTKKEKTKQSEIVNQGTDINEGSDADILYALSEKFNTIFNHRPSHPKYNQIVKDLTELPNREKTLVFVRRIASIYQIAEQVLEKQDQQLWEILQIGSLQDLSYAKLDRLNFTNALKNQIDIADAELDSANEDRIDVDQENRIPESKVLDLFKIKKGDNEINTPASNFRKQFNPSGSSVLGLFFSPGADYEEKPYSNLELLRLNSGNTIKANYFRSAMRHRLSFLEAGICKDIERNLDSNYAPGKNAVIEDELDTFFTLFFKHLRNDVNIENNYRNNVINTYKNFNAYEKESFSKFIHKGALHAAEAIVEFCQIWFQTKGESVTRYKHFIELVNDRLPSMRLYLQVQESILLFKILYSKEFAITTTEALLEENWNNFDNAQPIYPYSRGNSNQQILKSFNTPFYPDVLIATSVLQEGVNLQYFCDSVYHYGMAWTPGDNEQRVGRIDRMFGKIDRRLQNEEIAKLKISYPYLKDTIDEEQLRRFVKKKFQSENLIDRGLSGSDEDYSRFDDNDNTDWKQFLRKPNQQTISDPYPALHTDFNGISNRKPLPKKIDLSIFFKSIAAAISELSEMKPKTYYLNQNGDDKLLVDPVLESGRMQPVYIELVHDAIGSGCNTNGRAVYCLQMSTPICKRSELKNLCNDHLLESLPFGIKLCLNNSLNASSYWACYMAAELPLFIADPANNMLNANEIKTAFKQLVLCADQIEMDFFKRDKNLDELGITVGKAIPKAKEQFRTVSRSRKAAWEIDGDYYYLLHNEPIKEIEKWDGFKKVLILNAENLYIKSYIKNKTWQHEVSYLRHDAQSKELELMKKHLDAFRLKTVMNE